MTYIEGFLIPVPAANRDAFEQHARMCAPFFQKHGVTRVVEAWGDDVPDGKVNDLKKSVNAEPGETVVFSWFEYPDKAARDAANASMRADSEMAEMGGKDMPFDGARMIMSGFESIVEAGSSQGTGYIDGYVLPVPAANKESYRAMAAKCAPIFQEYGALRVVEAWGDDTQDGRVTDYNRATLKQPEEEVVYSFVEWPDKATRDAAWGKIMGDDRMKPDGENPFDGKRMMWGGFTPLVDETFG
ncbi:DUF1428 domain-containing protein [Sphingomonas sp.]|jgi:uncharacterized protein YbaA (DUF1428 family)|uniref:DUF1428 domain-containing protein n=1 Tax=Sphingomonas sp. TaxID=28214 RepID=UPI002ED99E1F